MVQALAIIQNEHRGMASVLSCLVNLVRDVETRGLEPDFELLHAIVDYVGSFLDRFHHPKEDRYLFRALAVRHPQAGELIDELQEEHLAGAVLGRELAAALHAYEAAGAPAFARFREAVEAYRDFQQAHIGKEEHEVIPLARRYLAPEDWRAIDEAFLANDDPLFGDRPAAEYRRLFSAIANMAPAPFGLGAPRPAADAMRRDE